MRYGAYQTWNDIPFNRGGNLAPGSLMFGTSPSGCATEFEDSFPIDLTGSFFVAAHGVAKGSSSAGTDPDCPVIVGIGFGGQASDSPIWGDLYGVNPNTGANEFYFSTVLSRNTPGTPNSLAFDGTSYYYNNSDNAFYSWLAGSNVQSAAGDGALDSFSASGTMAPNSQTFYYMPHQGDDDLIGVNVTTGLESPVCPDFFSPAGDYDLRYGDLAYDVDSDVIYGSIYVQAGPAGIAGKTLFFSVEPGNACAFQAIEVRDQDQKLQLAFGTDGVLYGHSTGNTGSGDDGAFYSVVPASGARTSLGTANTAGGVLLQFNDLAPGYEDCDIPGLSVDDTVWGFGQRETPGRQWGWIFRFDA